MRGAVDTRQINDALNQLPKAIQDYESALSTIFVDVSESKKGDFGESDQQLLDIDQACNKKEDRLLRLAQIYLLHARNLACAHDYYSSLQSLDNVRKTVDKYCNLKLICCKSTAADASHSRIITLSDTLLVYKALGRLRDASDLLSVGISIFCEEDTEIASSLMRRTHEDSPVVKIFNLLEMHVERAHILLKLGAENLRLTNQDLETVRNLSPNHPVIDELTGSLIHIATTERAQAVQALLNNRYQDAIQHLDTAIAARPNLRILLLERGMVYRKIGYYLDALEDTLESIIVSPAEKCKSPDEEEEQERLLQKSRSQLYLILLSMAVCFFQNCDYRGSLCLLDRIITLIRPLPQSYILHGDCNYALGDYEFALQDYEFALQLTMPKAKGRIDKNIDALKTELDRRICRTNFALSIAKIHDDRPSEALNLLNRCIELASLTPEIYATRANLHYYLGQTGAAWDDLMVCIYLLLSDWALGVRTENKWTKMTHSNQDRLLESITTYAEHLTGKLITRFIPTHFNLRKVANGKECQRAVRCIKSQLEKQSSGNKFSRIFQQTNENGAEIIDFSGCDSIIRAPLPKLKVISEEVKSSPKTVTISELILKKKSLFNQISHIRNSWQVSC
ncbi:unnamed protein product [Calicophoron daubneyi]|uniref:Tetratricopeptide repeat protein n=1 Tax=Calicophoron daubneyi TaxID=300641 RepID=A0AAV2TFA4_CALDB